MTGCDARLAECRRRSPLGVALLEELEKRLELRLVTGRRYARRARVERIMRHTHPPHRRLCLRRAQQRAAGLKDGT